MFTIRSYLVCILMHCSSFFLVLAILWKTYETMQHRPVKGSATGGLVLRTKRADARADGRVGATGLAGARVGRTGGGRVGGRVGRKGVAGGRVGRSYWLEGRPCWI